MQMRILPLAILMLCLPCLAVADWQEDLDCLLRSESPEEREALIRTIAEDDPDWRELVARVENMPFPAVEERGLAIPDSTICSDGVSRPWVLYLPSAYDPAEPAPLFVYLHGGVSRAELADDPLGYARENSFTAAAEENGWLVLFPFGQQGATWWDEVGMANIRDLLRTVKRRYNVDDDRVWMGGFSDGASASFMYAMLEPSDYAAFVALNGHMGVGSSAGDLPTYAANFAARPVYAVTTDRDGLYPSAKMAPTIAMARRAGADMYYRQYEGVHRPEYLEDDMGLIVSYLLRHPRDPLSPDIVWEAALPDFGRCDWFAIDRVSSSSHAAWHEDHNVAMISDRVSIGFIPDDAFEGKGVKIGRVVEDSFAEQAGLQADDVITAGSKGAKRKDRLTIDSMDDLVAFKKTLKRGDEVELTVRRGDDKLVLSGKLPEPEIYNLFKRDRPSAKALLSCSANRIEIEASRVSAFSVFVHPELIRLEQPLRIRINGERVFDAVVEPDLTYLLRNYIENRDRRLLYVARLAIELD